MPSPRGPRVFEKVLSPRQPLCAPACWLGLPSCPRVVQAEGTAFRERSWTSECHSGFTRDARRAVGLPTSPHDTVAPTCEVSRRALPAGPRAQVGALLAWRWNFRSGDT